MEEDRKMSHQVAIDVSSRWIKSMRARLEAPNIYRVPRHIRNSDKSAYEPKIISIGPYHRSKKGLKAMEDHKWRYLHQFLSRKRTICSELEKFCVDAIKPLEEKARNCYSEDLNDLKSNDFVQMMVLDGCFILELFLKLQPREMNDSYDPIFSTRWMLPLICHDMLLLENQLPFFILDRLFQLIEMIPKEESKTYLQKLALDFFRQQPLLGNNDVPSTQPTHHHLLHLLHSSLLPNTETNIPSHNPSVQYTSRKGNNSSNQILPTCTATASLQASNNRVSSPHMWKELAPLLGNFKWKSVVHLLLAAKASKHKSPPPPPPQPPKSIPGAAQLHGAGVKLKRNKEAKSFLEVKYDGSDGVMEIPHLLIDCYTNSLFRNFIAFEQCYPNSSNLFTSYAFFMDCIVNTPKDVALLSQHKIVEHWLGHDGDVALLFNRLCIGVAIDTETSYLSPLFKEVNDYCQTRWHKWRACLMRDYFSNPWAVISVAAAAFLLMLAVTQTFFSFMSYIRPPRT